MKSRRNKLAPCGVFCGVCPSFDKTCLGCASENKDQKRTSKWNCKIRNCCYNEKNKNYCIECDDFPCKTHKEKLIHSHPNNPKYKYRHEIPENFKKMEEMDLESYLEYQDKKWSCTRCGARIEFYHNRCVECGKKMKTGKNE